MKSILRFIIVLAVAVALGAGIYYLVNALPNSVQNFVPQREGFNSQGDPGQFAPPQGFRPEGFEGRERGGEGGFGLFGFVGIFGRFALFALITFVAVMIKNLFKKKSASKTATTN